MCKGGGSSGTNTVVQQSSPPANILANYQNVYNQAQGLSNAATASPGSTVAPLTPLQSSAINGIPALTGTFAPYGNTAFNDYNAATTPLYSEVGNYMSPYIQDVVNATQNQFNNENAIQQQGVIGNAVAQGAWGGDRSAVAQGIVAGQQQANEAPVIAGLYNSGYNTALGAAEMQGQLGLQAGSGLTNLGTATTGVYGQTLGDELQAGALQQNQEQALLNAPYQTTGWLANIAEGIGGASGGTSSSQYPGPSALSQAAGLGIGGLGLLGATGAFGSSGYLTGASGLLGGLGAAGSFGGDAAAVGGLGLSAADTAFLLGAKRGGGIPTRDGGGSVSNDLSEAAGYGVNGSGILSAAGGYGGVLQDLTDPSSAAGAGLLTALSLRRGGVIRRDGGGGIVPGAGPFGAPGESAAPVAISVMALPQRGIAGNPIVGGPPRPPYAPPSSWAWNYANPNNYGGQLSALAGTLHSSGIMGQRRGGAVRRYADGGDLVSGIAPPASGTYALPDVDPNTFIIHAAPSVPAVDPVAAFWAQNGANPAAAQGIARAVQGESGGDPSAIGDNGTSGGLYQHHASRLAALKDFAADQGAAWTDPNVQDQFALSEVHGGDPIAAQHWNQIRNAPDAGTAQALWERYFERPATSAAPASVAPDPSGGIVPSSPAFMGAITDTGEPAMGAGLGVVSAPQPSELGNLKSAGVDPWLALAAAGFGMASGTSPFAAANIGRGAEQGLGFLEQERQLLPEQRLRTAQAEQAEVTAGLTKSQLDYYANHGVNMLNNNLTQAGKELTASGARQVGATDGGTNPAPTSMTLPNTGMPIPVGGSADPMTQQLDEAYRQLDFLAGAPMLPAQKAQIIEQIARLRDTDPRVSAAKAGMAAQAEVGPKVQQAGLSKAAELPYTITTSRPGSTTFQGNHPIYTTPVQRDEVDPNTGMVYPRFISPPLPGSPAAMGNAPTTGGGIAGPGAPSGIPAGTNPIKLGPGQEEALKERAIAEQKDRQETIEDGQSSQQQQAILARLKDDAQQFKPGPFAEYQQTANSYMRALFGSNAPQVASFEDFVKNAGALTRAAVRETSSRAAVQEFRLIDATLPNPSMSPQGLNQVINEYQGLNDYRIAKVQAQQAWEQAHGGIGNVQGFETDWQSKISPYAFVFNRMDPDEQRGLVGRMRASPEGRAELGHLAQQLQYAKAAGLEPQ